MCLLSRLKSSLMGCLVLFAASSWSQQQARRPAKGDAEQTSRIFGLQPLVNKVIEQEAQRSCGSAVNVEELTSRQRLTEAIAVSLLDVDTVLAEISNERSKLGDARTALQGRRDHTVARLNSAALITGAGIGVGVNLSQITTFGSSTQNTGDIVGASAGIASVILSVLATRKQSGPDGSVGQVPNMLAPLFDEKPALFTYYPPAVMVFLNSVPATDDPRLGTRLEQLMAAWGASGRLDRVSRAKHRDKIAGITGSGDDVKVTIDDLTDRIAMLSDVEGRVLLIKRDVATLMHSYDIDHVECRSQPESIR